MSFVPLLISLGSSRSLRALGNILEQLAPTSHLSEDQALALLRTEIGENRAQEVVSEIAGDGLNYGNILELAALLFPGVLVPEHEAALSKRLAELEGSDIREIELSLASLAREMSASLLSGVDLLIDASTALILKISACETVPDAGQSDCRVLSLGFRGTFGGMAQTQLSSSPASIKVAGGVASSHGIRFLTRGDEQDTLGFAALRTLAHINRHAAWKAQSLLDLLVDEATRLDAIVIDSTQAWRVNGTFKLSSVFALGPADTLGVGIDLGLQVVERGEFQFTLTTAGDSLEIAIRKLESSERVTSESFGAELDLTGLTRRIFPQIRGQLGDVEKALGRVLELLPDKQFVDDQLGSAIGAALQRFPFKAELISAIGLDPHVTIEQRLTTRIADLTQRAEPFWDGSSQATVDSILDDLIGRLRLRNAEVEQSLRESLRTGLRGALTKVDKALKENVEEAIRTGRRKLIGALNTLDEDDPISRRVSNLATLSQKVRTRVNRYQSFVARLGDRLEQSANRRIGLRASAETQRLRSTEADIRLRFDPCAPEADELLRRLLLSDVETVFREALRGDVAGPVTVVNRASLRHFEQIKQTAGYEAGILGFQLGGQSMLDASTEIVEDAAGNLTVVSRMGLSRRLKSFFDRRGFDLVNVFQLAAARQLGTATLTFSTFREDGGLEPKTIEAFIGSARALDLVTASAAERFPSVLAQAVSETVSPEVKASRINVGATLTRAQSEQLIALGSPVRSPREVADALMRICVEDEPEARITFDAGGDDVLGALNVLSGRSRRSRPERTPALRPLRRQRVIEAACRALARTIAVVPLTEPDAAALRDLLRQTDFTGDVGDAVLRFDSIRFDPDVLGHFGSRDHRTKDWLEYRRKAVIALAEKALLMMWAVYHSGPMRWPVERYNRCQLELGKAIKRWFDRSGEQAWTFGLRGEIQPLTLALLRTLLDLADPDPFTPGPFLSVDLELLDANGGVLTRLVVS